MVGSLPLSGLIYFVVGPTLFLGQGMFWLMRCHVMVGGLLLLETAYALLVGIETWIYVGLSFQFWLRLCSVDIGFLQLVLLGLF